MASVQLEHKMFKKICDDEGGQVSTATSFEEATFQYLLSEKRTILLNDNIEKSIIEKLVIPIIGINELDDETEYVNKQFCRADNPIKVIINSNGGSAYETLSCISAIENSKTPVWTYALSKAWSGGIYILMAGHQRFCQRTSTLLYHQVQSGVPQTDLKSGEESLRESKRLQKSFEEFVCRRTKLKMDKIREIDAGKLDWFIHAKEALKYGIVDGFSY
jgi:ATP-dependent protease ClpP protease subunit